MLQAGRTERRVVGRDPCRSNHGNMPFELWMGVHASVLPWHSILHDRVDSVPESGWAPRAHLRNDLQANTSQALDYSRSNGTRLWVHKPSQHINSKAGYRTWCTSVRDARSSAVALRPKQAPCGRNAAHPKVYRDLTR